MNTPSGNTSPLKISTSRWVGYAVAGAATGLIGAPSVDGEIHYSGRLEVRFEPGGQQTKAFRLDQHGDSIQLGRNSSDGYKAFFGIQGLAGGAFAGSSHIEYAYPYRLKAARSRYISDANFVDSFYGDRGYLVRTIRGVVDGNWRGKTSGYVGFRFNNGSGQQYGWAHVRMEGDAGKFVLLGYAYADPGEPIKPGQTSSSADDSVTAGGSLGLLATGAVGLALWRRRRNR